MATLNDDAPLTVNEMTKSGKIQFRTPDICSSKMQVTKWYYRLTGSSWILGSPNVFKVATVAGDVRSWILQVSIILRNIPVISMVYLPHKLRKVSKEHEKRLSVRRGRRVIYKLFESYYNILVVCCTEKQWKSVLYCSRKTTFSVRFTSIMINTY